MQPILVLDTSAVIDLDQAYQKRYGLLRASQFLTHLQATAPGLKVLVPPSIKDEIASHRDYSIGGRPEISPQTLKRVLQYQSRDTAVQEFITQQKDRIDQARYCLRLLYPQVCNGKKGERDPISLQDWSIIDLAISLGVFSENQLAQNKENNLLNPLQGCYTTAVLTSDYHVYAMINRVFEEPEGVELTHFLKPVNVRAYTMNGTA
jgi:hypothetical protein